MNAQKTRYQDIEPQSYLENIGKADEDEIDIAHAALALAAVDMEGISLQRYQHHLDTLASSVSSLASGASSLASGASSFTSSSTFCDGDLGERR